MRLVLDGAVVAAFRRDSREVVRELELLRPVYGRTGTHPSECHALLEVARSPGLSPGELVRRLRLDKTAVSRLLRGLTRKGWVRVAAGREDGRQRSARLTTAGKRKVALIDAEADARVRASLACLSADEAEAVLRGMGLYARALVRSRVREGWAVRALRPADDAAVARVIRTVMAERDAAGPGFSVHDAEVARMSAAYAPPRAAYFVLTHRGKVVGGGGIGPLKGGRRDTCELRKMYFLPEARGKGFGHLLVERCLDAARDAGYARCYLETMRRFGEARSLYEKHGFAPIGRRLGKTGHHTCDAFYVRSLAEPAAAMASSRP